MRKIIIQQIALRNFKGIKDLVVQFSETETHIKGANGTGKTSIFDAFTWCLFGKDSKGRKAFDVKTLDENGNEIPKLEHEVTVELLVDEQEITLTKRLKEKWVKKRGEAEATFQGNEEERLYNDVPCNTKDWTSKIEDICPESTFRAITDPKYFTSLKSDAQREMLIQLAGGISDEDIARQSDDFAELLQQLNGKSFDEFKRELAAKKKPIKEQVAAIPARIDECQRMMPEALDFDALKAENEEHCKKVAELDKQISDRVEALNKQICDKQTLIMDRSLLTKQKLQRRFEIEQGVMKDFNDYIAKKKDIKYRIEAWKHDVQHFEDLIGENNNRIAEAESKMAQLRDQWMAVNARTIEFNDTDFVCPTCLRPLETNDIEAKQQQMTEAFNVKKAEELGKINQQGKGWKKLVENKTTGNAELQAKKDAVLKRIEELEADPVFSETCTAPDAQPAIDADEKTKSLTEQIEALSKKIDSLSIPADSDIEALKKERAKLLSEQSDIKIKLQTEATIKSYRDRIAELEKQMRTQSNELARLEGLEYVMQQFSKARIEAVENKINAMFSFVRFKMFEQQYNGGEKEICEAMVNGVPYSSLNSAMQINAGLDIINGISDKMGYRAPIFIDNAESVNNCIRTESQKVLLQVTIDRELVVLPCF